MPLPSLCYLFQCNYCNPCITPRLLLQAAPEEGTTRTPGTVCGKTKGTWGDESTMRSDWSIIKRLLETQTVFIDLNTASACSPFTIQDVLDAGLGDDGIVTFKPLVLVLADEGGVMATL